MLGGSTRVKGTTWSPGGRWGPWCTPTLCSMYSLELVKWSVRVWLLTVLVSVQSTSPFPASSSSAHGEECPKALKNNQPPHCTLLPPHFSAKIREERVTKRTGQPCPGRCSPASAWPCTLCWPAESRQIFLQSMWPSSFYSGKSLDSYSVCTWKNPIFLQSMWLSSYPKWGSEDSYSVSTWKNQIFLHCW